VIIMALSGNTVVSHHVGSLRYIGPKLVFKGIRNILRISSMISVISSWAVKVQRSVWAGHEWAIDRYLMKIDTCPTILSITIEKHTKLEQWIWTVFNAGNQYSKGHRVAYMRDRLSQADCLRGGMENLGIVSDQNVPADLGRGPPTPPFELTWADCG
jgi:hypothetical protein